MDYQYNNGIRYDPQADSDHYWVFGGCIKNISPDRPPILNYDNISSEAGVPVNDPNEAAQVDALSMNINVHLIEHAPSSYPSINDGSVSSPNGPERKDLNNFLPVAPATGLGEMQHRRRESFDDVEDQLSYSLRKWARTLPAHARSFDPSWEGMQGGWLRQDTHIVGPTDSVRATRGKSCGSASVSPGSMYSSASPGWRSPNTYHLNEMGTWTIGSPLGGWPLEIEEEAISTNTIPFIKANASRLSSDSFVSSDLHHITPKLAGRVAFRCFNVPETPRLRELSCETVGSDRIRDESNPGNGVANIESSLAVRKPFPLMQFDSSATPRKSKSKYNELLRTILLLVQHAIFDYLMQEFYVVFDQKWQANLKNCAESSLPSSGSDEASGNLLESNTSEAAMGSKKRTRTNPEEDRPDRGGKDDPKKLKLGPEMADRRLACPYHKRDPQEFGVGTTHHVCAGQGWKDIAKLKEHLYRRHHFFYQCQRCKIVLKSQPELNEHSEAVAICQSRSRQLEDGFDVETFVHLHNKRKTSRGQTEAERWKEIFKQLFPNTRVPSPYVTYEAGNLEPPEMSELDDLENFEAYRQREMPIEFAKRATLAALRSSQPIARHLSGQVYDMIRDSQDAVSQKYQGVLTDEQRIVPEMHQSTLVPSPTLPLQSQSMLQLQTDQMSESNISYDPPKPHQPSHMCETDKTFIPEDLQYSNMSDLEFGLEEINTCFCMDPCTCLGAAPTCHPVETFPRESDPLLLQILQNISSRLAKLEQQSGDPISCPTKSISPSILAHPLSIDNAVFCSRSLEPITERAGNRNASVHNQEFLCNLSQLSKGLGSSANKSNDALNWDLIDFDILND